MSEEFSPLEVNSIDINRHYGDIQWALQQVIGFKPSSKIVVGFSLRADFLFHPDYDAIFEGVDQRGLCNDGHYAMALVAKLQHEESLFEIPTTLEGAVISECVLGGQQLYFAKKTMDYMVEHLPDEVTQSRLVVAKPYFNHDKKRMGLLSRMRFTKGINKVAKMYDNDGISLREGIQFNYKKILPKLQFANVPQDKSNEVYDALPKGLPQLGFQLCKDLDAQGISFKHMISSLPSTLVDAVEHYSKTFKEKNRVAQ